MIAKHKHLILSAMALLAFMLFGCGPQDIDLADQSIKLKVGEKKKLEIELEPKEVNAAIEWSSEDDDIAEVSDDGEVEGKKIGKTKVEAKIAGTDDKSAECDVKVVSELEGTWYYAAGTTGYTYTFEMKTWSFKKAENSVTVQEGSGTFSYDKGADPETLDLTIEKHSDSNEIGKTIKTIYKLKDDKTLTIVKNNSGATRPADFSSNAIDMTKQ